MKAVWNGAVIAESDETVEVEGNQYFPAGAVKKEYLRKSEYHTTCPWKGEASYYHIEVNGKKNENAAWFYAQPKTAASKVGGYVAFWKGVEVTD